MCIRDRDVGLAGIEVYDLLRDEYDIQIEFGDIGNILAYLSIGDRPQELERLVSALAEIRRRYQTDGSGLMNQEYIAPEVVTSPQEAFYADKRSVRLEDSVGQVCSEFVMCYPPGLPILAPVSYTHLDAYKRQVFESANFDGTTIRRTALALGMRTEASAKYEKGLDPLNTCLLYTSRCV